MKCPEEAIQLNVGVRRIMMEGGEGCRTGSNGECHSLVE